MSADESMLNVAYVTSRFPLLSETFITMEVTELERQGVHVDLYALVRERASIRHPEAEVLEQRCVFPSFPRILTDQLYWLARRPLRYLRVWMRAILGNLRSPRFLLRAIVAVPVATSFARRVRQSEAQHIHAHWATHSGLAAYLIHLLTDLSYSLTIHAHDLHVDTTMLAEKLEAASAIVTISEYNRRSLRDRYGPEVDRKVDVVRCGVDPTAFSNRRLVDRDSLSIVSVGSLEYRKGHHLLIDACASLRDRGVPFSCVIVGDGPESVSLREQVEERHLAERVRLVGALQRYDVVEVLRDADVSVLASITLPNGKSEGIPVALMEAMALELPVVATDMTGIPELVEHGVTGLLIGEGDVEALSDALGRLAEDRKTAREMGRRGRARVEATFALEDNVRRLRGVFSAVVDDPGSEQR